MEMKNKALLQVHTGHNCNIELKAFFSNSNSYSLYLVPLGLYIYDEFSNIGAIYT